MSQVLTFAIGDPVTYDSSEGRKRVGRVHKIRDTDAEPLKVGIPLSRYLLTLAMPDDTYRTVYHIQCKAYTPEGWGAV